MDKIGAYYPPPAGYYQPPPPPPPFVAIAPPPPPHGAVPLPRHLQHSEFVPHAPPPYATYAAAPRARDELRTLFVAGLPEDVKHREIYNLFREFPGYESSQLRTPTQSSQWQPFAFATFLDQQSALGAMHALNGMVFDLEKGSTLYVEFAKSNSKSKRSRADDERFGSEKKARGPPAFSRTTFDSGVGSVHVPGMSNTAYSTIGYPSTQSYAHFDGRAANEPTATNLISASAHQAPFNSRPCPTLFVACLGPTCTEQELNDVFSRCPGFLKLKMQGTYGAPVAFVDFQDIASSSVESFARRHSLLLATRRGNTTGVRQVADGNAQEAKVIAKTSPSRSASMLQVLSGKRRKS